MLEGVDRVNLTSFGLLAIRIVQVAPNWASLPSAEEVFFPQSGCQGRRDTTGVRSGKGR